MRFYVLLTILILGLTSFAQNKGGITIDETLQFINNKLKGDVVLKVKNTKLILSYYKDGQLYREDEAFCGELDTNKVKYVPEEKMLVFGCAEEYTECVHRYVYGKMKTSNYNKRMTIDVSAMDEASIKSLRRAFMHMIRLMTNVKYSCNEPF